jgi:dTDP-4-dehydrorhamnose reductase
MKIIGSSIESGVYHVVPDGEASWYDLAVLAIDVAVGRGTSLGVRSESILPVTAVDFPMLAKRPYNSRLNNGKLKKVLSDMAYEEQYPCWRDQVKDFIDENSQLLFKDSEVNGENLCR